MNKHKILPLLNLCLIGVGGVLPISINCQLGVRSRIIVLTENLELHRKRRCPHLRRVFNFIVLQGGILFAVGENNTNIC